MEAGMKEIRVLVVCATALATSTMAAMKLEEEFQKRGIPIKTDKGRIMDMVALIEMTKPDIVVATAVYNMDVGVPILNGVPLLSGLGLDELYQEIFKIVEKIQKGGA